jgi:hypothetical protein
LIALGVDFAICLVVPTTALAVDFAILPASLICFILFILVPLSFAIALAPTHLPPTFDPALAPDKAPDAVAPGIGIARDATVPVVPPRTCQLSVLVLF